MSLPQSSYYFRRNKISPWGGVLNGPLGSSHHTPRVLFISGHHALGGTDRLGQVQGG